MKKRPISKRTTLDVLATTLVVLVACGDADYGGWDYEHNYPGEEDYYESPADYGVSPGYDAQQDLSEEPFIPEEDEDFRLQMPAASRSYVFVANTNYNSVAKIDSLTLHIETINVGLEPTVVRTSPSGDTAVVLNKGSNNVSVILADEGDRVVFVDAVPGANSLILSPRGDYAIAWFNNVIAEPSDSRGWLSDATLISLTTRPIRAYNLVVGLNIRQIQFNDAGDTAYFITDDGVAVVRMPSVSRDQFFPPVRLSPSRLEAGLALDQEVEITSDGRFALVRSSDSAALRLVNLSTNRILELELGSIPTDLDLLPGGQEIVAVLRGAREFWVIPVPEGFQEPELIDRISLGEEEVGLAVQIANTRQFALYSTLNENDHLSLLDLDRGVMNTYALRKGIESVYVSPDGQRLLIFHTKLPGEPIPGSPNFVERSYAFTVFNLDYETPRMVFTDTRPGAFTFTEDGQHVFIIQADETRGISGVVWTNLSSGRDRTISLRRVPDAIGVIPATGRVYVSQDHEVGRMAFINAQNGEVREVTGYYLNSRTE